jgi:P-type Ca2+ transporter type 2C
MGVAKWQRVDRNGIFGRRWLRCVKQKCVAALNDAEVNVTDIARAEAFRFHAQPLPDVLAHFGVSAETGLAPEQASQRLEVHGPNQIASRRRSDIFVVLLHQFQSPVVYLLAGAVALAAWFGEWEEATAILVVLALNAAIGFSTELKAKRAIEALRALGSRSCRVRRGGRVIVLSAEQLVPGDIVQIEAGDAISADMRLIEASNLAADESTLTGESVAVEKSTMPVAAEARLGDQSSMLFKGTSVTRGSGVGVVVGTGLDTQLGLVSRLVEEAEPGASPIEKNLGRLSGQLIWTTLVLTALIGGVGMATGQDALLMAKAAIALAVAAIPEGLPIVATLALARGMWRMARRQALIEQLSAVETLGATTIILTDKTGTLTENRMAARRLSVPSGEIELEQSAISGGIAPPFARLLKIAVLCNDASLETAAGEGSGDPMEVALLRAGFCAGLTRSELLRQLPLSKKHAFDTSTRMMATVHRLPDRFLFAIKGAPEAVLFACSHVADAENEVPMDDATRAQWMRRVDQLGQRGLRVLACATKAVSDADAAPYAGLTFVGLVGLEDPARADVPKAIQDCKAAGIRVVMVTGDHAVTARSIAEAVGFGRTHVIEGRDLGSFIENRSSELLNVGIFARVDPAEKLELVRAYQSAGEVVAMTGDGVNDAAALKQADIGIAMGRRGTDVAREAAAMILLDDAFSTIVMAIREGRVIFGNIRRFAAYLLSCNLSEVLVVGLAILLTLPLPIQPMQILYLNLITDVFPAFALAMGEGDARVLERPPRSPKEPILTRMHWITIVFQSIAMASATFGAMLLSQIWLNLEDRSVVTVTFLTLAFAQLWHMFDIRHSSSSALYNEVTRNPWIWASLGLCSLLLAVPPYLPPIANVLHLVPPTAEMWTIIVVSSAAPLVVMQGAMILQSLLRPAGSR